MVFNHLYSNGQSLYPCLVVFEYFELPSLVQNEAQSHQISFHNYQSYLSWVYTLLWTHLTPNLERFPSCFGEDHYNTAPGVQKVFQTTRIFKISLHFGNG